MIKRILVWALSVTLILNLAKVSFADTPARKLGRGMVNIATGWMELPVQIYKGCREDNNLIGFATGTIKGFLFSMGRSIVGIYETFTFFLPHPKDYGPIILPEFVTEID